MLSKIINRLRISIWKHNRKIINRKNRERLRVNDTTIISMNCNGGVISHDLGLKFLSPTVNLYMRAEDFIKFCENLEYYLSLDMVECNEKEIVGERTYPVARLGDIILFLVHYPSVEAAREKWDLRRQRVNYQNIVILNTDREGTTEELKDRFEKLPYRKVMFTHLPDNKHKSCFYIKGYEKDDCVGIITEMIGWKGLRPIDQFDYVSWLNGDEVI